VGKYGISHSQTETYSSKRFRKPKKSELNPNWRAEPKYGIRKVKRSTKEHLSKLLWSQPTTKIAEYFGVSDKAVEKWAKIYGIKKPGRGYWTKTKC
jgi:hypothetical protein